MRLAIVALLLLLYYRRGTPIGLRAVFDHQLEHFDVGRDCRAEERRRVLLWMAAQRGVVNLADKRLVRIGSPFEQQLYKLERRELIGMIDAKACTALRPTTSVGA